jgi:predicted AAA+ superfamily ATPase
MNDLVERKRYLEQLEKLCGKHIIKVITGLRRSGKSVLMEMFAGRLRESGIPDSRIQMYNFEKPWPQADASWRAIYRHIVEHVPGESMSYVFLDEPQQIPDFERLIDALFVEKNVDLYVTGSNAYFLSGEIATLLSGRYITIPVLPFSFGEYVEALQKTGDAADKYAAFRSYLYETSLPQGVFFRSLGSDIQSRYVQDVYSTVVEKDIMQRYHIQSSRSFDNVARYLMGNIGSRLSPGNISNALKRDRQAVHHATVERYVQYLADSFLFYPVSRFDIKGKQQLATQEKYYLVDVGFRNVKLGKFQHQDAGHILENIVYLELCRRGCQVWTGKINEYEVDFIAKNSDNKFAYYQATWSSSSPEAMERELRPLKAIRDNYPKYILSTDMLTAEIDGIEHVNVVDWLLNG